MNNRIKYKQRKKTFSLLIITFLLALLVCNCAVTTKPCIKNGKDYSKIKYKVIIDDWDSCYLRGCSYMEGNCIDLAIEEFKKAIDDRPRDKRLARPYGLRFMGYFPHRELGIIYYRMGLIEKAIKELEGSLLDSPSSKGKYFLNKARRRWLQEKGVDASSPWLHVSFPSSSYYITNKLSLTIKGLAEDDQFVSALSVNDEPIFIELSAKSIPFTHTVSLKKGLNHITVSTSDLVGRSSEKILKIMVDRMGPLINLSHSPIERALGERKILIKGIIFDETGVNKFSLNGKSVKIKRIGEMAEFIHWIDLPEGLPRLSFWAIDEAGNKTSGTIELSPEIRTRRRFRFRSRLRQSLAYKPNSISNKHELIRTASLDMPTAAYLATYKDNHLIDNAYWETTASDTEPFLFFERLPRETIYNEIYLLGKIQYKTDISIINIFLNKRLISRKAYDYGLLKLKSRPQQEGEKILCLSEIIELDPGENEIIIEITNKAGITRKKTFFVTKRKEKMLDQKYRLCVSVLPIEDISEPEWRSPSFRRKAFKELKAAFVNQKRFQVLAREIFDDILKELKFITSDLFDPKNALRVGKLLNAEAIITGSLWRNSKKALELKATITDVELAKDLYCEDIYLEGDPNNPNRIIAKATKILAMKIRSHFPLCKGKVIKKKGAKIKVDISLKRCDCVQGGSEKINEDTKLLVYREKEWDIQLLSGARVERVFDTYLRAVLLRKKKVKVEDLVITK